MKIQVRQRGAGGFSLIEVMVVLAILAALITTGSVLISVANKKKMETQTRGNLTSLAAALEQLHGADQLQRYPPTDIQSLKIGGVNVGTAIGRPNDTNIGAETLYLVFRMKGVNVMPQGLDESVANTDGDMAVSMTGNMQKADLFEYVDAWGNPIVYFSSADYKDPSKVEQYVLKDGQTTVKVSPKRNAQTAEYVRATSFQLFSLGPDGQPDTDDDIEFK